VKARSRPRGRVTPVVAYVVSGIIGGTTGLLVAMDAIRRDRSGPGLHPVETAWIPPLVTMVAIVAGVLVAWFSDRCDPLQGSRKGALSALRHCKSSKCRLLHRLPTVLLVSFGCDIPSRTFVLNCSRCGLDVLGSLGSG